MMLDVGLYSALEELCDSLGERPDSDSSIHFALSTSDAFHTYPAQVQESLFSASRRTPAKTQFATPRRRTLSSPANCHLSRSR
ncbi:MAG: hypothetical protein R2856_14055 [Caldilineaceae bacterium]